MIGEGGNKTLDRHHHGRQAALHICGASAVEHAVLDGRLEGWLLPAFGGAGGHDVGMAGKTQYRAVNTAAGPEVVYVAEAHRLKAKATGVQTLAHQLLTAGIIRSG